MLRTTFVASLCIVALASSAWAQDDEQDFSREGPYLGIDGMFVLENSAGRLHVSHTGGAGARMGFRLTPEFAMEVMGDWAHLGGRNPWTLNTVVKLYPMAFATETADTPLQPFVTAGVGIISGRLGRSKDPAGSFRLGLGTDFWLTNDLAATTSIAYLSNAGDAEWYDAIHFKLGVTWRY